MIEFHQQFDAAEVKREVEIWYKLFIGKSIYMWLGLAFMVFAVVYSVRDGLAFGKPGITLLIGTVIYLFYVLYLRRRITIFQVYNSLSRAPGFGEISTINITEAGTVRIECGGRKGEHKLSEFTVAAETADTLMLFVRKSGWLTLRRSGFSPEDYIAFKRNLSLNNIMVKTITDRV